MNYFKKLKFDEIEKNLSSEDYDEDFLNKLIPYYENLLNEDYKNNQYDYIHEVAGLKGLGYRVFRNSNGAHRLKYDDVLEL